MTLEEILCLRGKNLFETFKCHEDYIKVENNFWDDLTPINIREAIYAYYCNISEIPKCPICLKTVEFKKTKYPSSCSIQCSGKLNVSKRIATNLEKYGVENVSQLDSVKEQKRKSSIEKYGTVCTLQATEIKLKSKKTNIEKYGHESSNSSQDVKLKKIESLTLKYGVQNPMLIEGILDDRKENSLNKNGVECPQQQISVKEKIKTTCLEKYGVSHPAKNENIKYKFSTSLRQNSIDKLQEYFDLNEKNLTVLSYKDNFVELQCICGKISTIFVSNGLNCTLARENNIFRCLSCFPINTVENKIREYIQDLLKIKTGFSTRSIISPLEIDIFIPEYSFAIEYNGIMYHSSGDSKYSKFSNTDPIYHLIKTQKCEEKNIQLYHIFSNEWTDLIKQNIWKSMIENKLQKSQKIYARKCTISDVPLHDQKKFLTNSHMQGYCIASKAYGLYHDGALVSLMTFCKTRFSKKYEWELLRFCNALNVSVVGGAAKLLKHFELQNSPESLVSYANKRWSDGNLYFKLGLDYLHTSSPNYFYFKPNESILYSRNVFQKHKLKDKLEIFDENLSETQNMYNNGYRKIYDCGNMVFCKKY